jgi:glycolate oxidase
MNLSIADDLRRIAKGEVLSDNWSRKIYSMDASHYEIKPAVIYQPVDENDLEIICQHCFRRNITMTARGAGTGLLGQSLSDQIVIDLTKNMNKIIEVEDDYVTVQPGLVKGMLDRELKKRLKFLPPDPASSNFCTIGGMLANNSSGPHSLGYGSTIDFTQEITVIYADGTRGFAGANIEPDDKIASMLKLLSPYLNVIQKNYPKVTKNSCGYRLDAVLSDQGFFPQKIFTASEGTLGIITSAKFKILDIPVYRNLLVIGFQKLSSAMKAVPTILDFCPVALEMLDNSAIYSGRHILNNNVGCLLFAEFASDTLLEVETRLSRCRNKLEDKCEVLESASDEKSMTCIWNARKNALNNIMKLTLGSRKPVGLIEDTVVSPNLLHDYSQYLLKLYLDNKLEYVMYGHVGNGNLHTRPLIDLERKSEMELLEDLANKVFDRVINYRGTITGEHGDGLARIKYVEKVYGGTIYTLFKQIKKLFDPNFIMNPGKKLPLV